MSEDNVTLKLPASEIQNLDAGTIVYLYVFDATILGGSVYYLSPNVNEYGVGIQWKDMTGATVTYQPFPIVASGFERSSQGTQNRPTLNISNVNHLVSDLVRQYGDLCGCTVIRRRVMAKHLDLANFTPGSALYLANASDRTIHYPDDSYSIERRASETPDGLSFELSNAMDVQGIMIPRRMVQRNLCTWVYQGADNETSCPFAGPFTGGNTTCGKTVADCKVKFPGNVKLPFGGWNGARRM